MTGLDEAESAAIARVLATTSNWALDHVRQVERLSVALFHELEPFHGFGRDEGVILRAAALLHDVGYPVNPATHHKISGRIIREHLGEPFSARHVQLIALVARYHRKALPKLSQRRYAALDERGRRLVTWLGGILRVADGLDRTHADLVRSLDVSLSEARIDIQIFPYAPGYPASARVDLDAEIAAAMKKRNLLERAVGMPVVVHWG